MMVSLGEFITITLAGISVFFQTIILIMVLYSSDGDDKK